MKMDLGAWLFCFLFAGIIILINPIMWILGSSLDDRIGLLKKIGFHISETTYKRMKGKEIKKRSLKAMKTAIKKYLQNSNDEKDFLQKLHIILSSASEPSPFKNNYDLNVKYEFIEMADRIVRKRLLEINKPIVPNDYDFNKIANRINYITILTDEYHPGA